MSGSVVVTGFVAEGIDGCSEESIGNQRTGEEPFSWQSGHSLSSDSSNEVRTHSSQKELPQQGIITASLKRSLQMLQMRSSGTSGFFSAGGAGSGLDSL